MPNYRTDLPEKFATQTEKNAALGRLENERGYWSIRAQRAALAASRAEDCSFIAKRAVELAKRIPVRR